MAIALLNGSQPTGRVQILTVTTLEAERREIEALAAQAHIEVSCRVEDPKLPGDPRLRRMTVHTIIGEQRDLVMDVYNAAGHEVVPCIEATLAGRKVMVGTPFVLARFRLIDMWTVHILNCMKAVSDTYASRLRVAAFAGFEAAVHQLSQLPIEKLFPLDTFVGNYEDPLLAQKRGSRKGGRFRYPPPPFYPLRETLRSLKGETVDADVQGGSQLSSHWDEWLADSENQEID